MHYTTTMPIDIDKQRKLLGGPKNVALYFCPYLHMTGYVIITLSQIVCKVCQSQNFENRSVNGNDIDRSKVARFFGPRCIVATQQKSTRGRQSYIL